MQKIINFLNKYALLFNSISIAFWLYIIYANYKISSVAPSADERKAFYIIPIIFIIVSGFNIVMALKRKNKD